MYAYDIEIKDDSLVYASSMIPDSLRVINIANPDTLRVIGSSRRRWARTMFLRDNLLYLGCQDGFYIFNVSNPILPTLMGSVPFESDAYGLYVTGNYAYLGDGCYWSDGDEGGFRIFNVANPNSPYQIAHYIPPNCDGCIKNIYVRNDTAYVCDDAYGLRIFNVANPSNPLPLTLYSNCRPVDIVIRGNLAFLADGYFGIRVLDISNIYSIRELAHYRIGGYANSIKLIGNYIHVAFSQGGYLIFEYYGPGAIEEVTTQEPQRRLSLKVFPSPSKNRFVIEFSALKDDDATLDIMDTLGRIKKSIKLEKIQPGNYRMNLDLTGLAAGVYFIRLSQDENQVLRRIVIVK
jgi:hypothetical protein